MEISHGKGKASTAKQTYMGSFQGPEGKGYRKRFFREAFSFEIRPLVVLTRSQSVFCVIDPSQMLNNHVSQIWTPESS